jgi:hypothetical protein
MKRTAIMGIATTFLAPAALAAMDCAKGNPWRLPLPPPGWSTVEAPIKVDGAPGQMVLICNCTAPVEGKTTGVWVRASLSTEFTRNAVRLKAADAPKDGAGDGGKKDGATGGGGTTPYYLPGQSCVSAGTATIVLAPVDRVETWGYFQFEGK